MAMGAGYSYSPSFSPDNNGFGFIFTGRYYFLPLPFLRVGGGFNRMTHKKNILYRQTFSIPFASIEFIHEKRFFIGGGLFAGPAIGEIIEPLSKNGSAYTVEHSKYVSAALTPLLILGVNVTDRIQVGTQIMNVFILPTRNNGLIVTPAVLLSAHFHLNFPSGEKKE